MVNPPQSTSLRAADSKGSSSAQCQSGNTDEKVKEEGGYAGQDRPPSFQTAGTGEGWESGINAGGNHEGSS